jgi:hypothetical protein
MVKYWCDICKKEIIGSVYKLGFCDIPRIDIICIPCYNEMKDEMNKFVRKLIIKKENEMEDRIGELKCEVDGDNTPNHLPSRIVFRKELPSIQIS